jgi:hypothetical protein
MVANLTRDSSRPKGPPDSARSDEHAAPLHTVPDATSAPNTSADDVDNAVDGTGTDINHVRPARGVFLGIIICAVAWAVIAVVWRFLL